MNIVRQLAPWIVLLASLAFVVYVPILKPWFGFRKPKGHAGKWFE